MKKGIDVSSYQGRPDWEKVKESGVEFAILRIMTSKRKDSSFEHNYAGCGKNGIARGVYRYSYALTVSEAQKEARDVVNALEGRELEMGVWLDLEWSRQRNLGSRRVKEIANAWMKVIRDHGYECNIYCNLDWYRNVCGGLDAVYWIARYPSGDNGTIKESLRPNVGEVGWQYSSKGKVPGISGNVDMDVWYGAGEDKKPEDNAGEKPSALKEPIKVGDIVTFSGRMHYNSSYAGAKGLSCTPGKAKVTAISKGKPHPYHLVHVEKKCTVYGWVDEKYVRK